MRIVLIASGAAKALRYLAAALLMLALVASRRAEAQAPSGTIVGTVRASTSATLAGAMVTVRNETVGLQRSTASDEDGAYVVTNLPVQGTYDVRVEFSGFAPVVRTGISLAADTRVVVDVIMRAATEETLVVTGRVAGLDVQRTTVEQTVSDRLVHGLPLIGREFITLSSLTAGFAGNPYYPTALGQLYWSNNVLVDGASHYSKWRGAARTFYAGYPLEAIKEVEVLTTQFSAEYGEALASVTTAVTNSGTNDVHGSVLLFVQDDLLHDIPMFALRKPPFGMQRFGVTLGGPLVKDRTHLFTSYEGRRQRGHGIVVSPVAAGALTRNDEDEHLVFFKVDHKPSQNDLISARYNGQRFRWRDEPGGLSLPGVGTQLRNDVHTTLLTNTTLFSSTTLNQTRVQFARYTDQKDDLQPSLYVSRAGYSVTGGLLGPYGFGTTPEDTWEASNTLAHKREAHSLKIGGGLKWVGAHNEALRYGHGAYLFAGDPVTFPFPTQFVQSFAPSAAAASADPESLSTYVFAQDDWRVHDRLSLNLGLRYDVESLRHIVGVDVPADRNNVQPRLGVAWRPIEGGVVVRGGVGIYNQQHLLFYVNRVQLEGIDGTTTLTLNQESPLMPLFPNVLPASAATLLPRDVQQLAPAFRNPYSVQMTAGIEQSLFGAVIGTDVVVLRGYDLMSLVDINAPVSNTKPATRTVAAADLTRPIVPVAGGLRKIVELGNRGESWYRALHVKASRLTGRVQTMASYTWALAEDQANYQLPEDSRDLDAEKGRADNDIRHNVTAGFIWEVPPLRSMLNGLSLSGVASFRSGRPYTSFWGDDRNGTSQNDARPGKRNTVETDGFGTIDLALARQFRVKRRAIEGRLEAFNVLSRVNFDQYVGTLSIYYAQPVTAFPRRRIQVAAIVRF